MAFTLYIRYLLELAAMVEQRFDSLQDASDLIFDKKCSICVLGIAMAQRVQKGQREAFCLVDILCELGTGEGKSHEGYVVAAVKNFHQGCTGSSARAA